MLNIREALYWEKRADAQVLCTLCPHRCLLSPEESGLCGARKNREGTLIPLTYGEVSSLALDPIEKKPLRRFHPGSVILSVGSVGCNMDCPYCQNHEIARGIPGLVRTRYMSPESLVEKALSLTGQGNIGLAYTYNEPLIWYEMVLDTGRLIREAGMKNVLVTNGFISPEPLEQLLPLVDALNIDLKSFRPEVYRDRLGGGLKTVKETIRMAARQCHVEVTTLVVPGMNDDPEEIRQLAAFLGEISPDIPLHLTRFFPRHRMSDGSPTPAGTLNLLVRLAGQYLNHVYPGNI